jgi:hypothetical protein
LNHDARNHKLKKNDNNSFESVEEFKHLGTTVTNQNSIKEELRTD